MNLHHRLCHTLSLVLTIAAFAAGCTTQQTSDKDLVFISATEAQELAVGRKRFLGLTGADVGTWVDARSPADYRKGHIPGAINLPFERVLTDHHQLKGHPILIVYGADYNDARANGMSKQLIELGYEDVRTLNGGIRAWTNAGNELVEGDEPL